MFGNSIVMHLTETEPEIHLLRANDGLGFVLDIANKSSTVITVCEPHPHTNVELYSANGNRHPQCRGVFAARPHWEVTLSPGDACKRLVFLPDWYLDAKGTFTVVAKVPFQTNGSQSREITIRGSIKLDLPTFDEYYHGEIGQRCITLRQSHECNQFSYDVG